MTGGVPPAPLRGRPTRFAHLVRRFGRSLLRRRPTPADEAFVQATLTPVERAVWRRFPPSEASYTIRVARRAEALLADAGVDPADTRWTAAALLHDAGKLDAGLGLFGRVLATVAGAVVPRVRRSKGRLGRYLHHAGIGASLLRAAGARPEVAAWAAVHHEPTRWAEGGIPPDVARALAAADDA